ncbi:hypothetical protein [Aquibacillus salsiterrae]|uniref:Uncharacterized protein n=1 Tax=Aquibacillus salsiterrae TaxID=2950439 RepID=A0A9X4AGG8_9BACI|nr:hypothetical protein [Aquibacillus salsiterrae]MDC3417083.1 hypothetical protein [Aquibacillus salsiterrae]
MKKVNKDLEKLGVEFLSKKEVKEKFPKYKNEKYLKEHLGLEATSLVTPLIDQPSDTNDVDWSTYRSTVYQDGETYDVQRLVAQPNSSNSELSEHGFRTIRSTYNWKAGYMNVLSTGAKTAAGEIPGAGIALSVYDAFKGMITGISKETTITDANINYSWNIATTAVFSYVKLASQSDDYQDLSYISTRLDGKNFYTLLTFEDENGDFKAGGEQGQRDVFVVPSGYDSGFNAVDAYLSPYAKSRATVTRYDIAGIEGSHVSYVYLVDPSFPAHVY